MKKWLVIIVLLGALGWILLPKFFSPVSRTVAMREALERADTVHVYEGLPHQSFEVKLLEKERKRPDVFEVAGYPFYAPAIEVPEETAAELKKYLVDAGSYHEFVEGKECGGFHPDYAIQWKRKRHTYWLLICFGCGDVIFTDGTKSLKLGINGNAEKPVQELLKVFRQKRPARTK